MAVRDYKTVNVEISPPHNNCGIDVLCIEVYKLTELLKEHFKMYLLSTAEPAIL